MGRHARRLSRVRGVSKKQVPSAKAEKDSQNEASVDVHEENFCQDEIDEFHEAKEKLLLEGRGSNSSDDGLSGDEEEVMGWSEEGESGEEEEEEEFQLPPSLRRQFYASDEEEIEEQQQQNEISNKAWGHKKKTFYAVEGEDELSGSEGSEMAAELEEKEAIALQQRMAAALKDSDFLAPSIPVTDGSEEREMEGKQEQVLRDLSKLTSKDKLALLEKSSPELFDLLEDFESCLSEAVHVLHPLVTVARDTATVTEEGRKYLETKLNLNLIYCMNIMFYLYLKSSGVPVQSHPVIQRIVEIRQLIGRLEPIDEQLEGQVETLLKAAKSSEREMKEMRDEKETDISSSSPNCREKSQEKQQGPVDTTDENESISTEEGRREEELSLSVSARVEEEPLVYYERVAEQKKKMRKQRREESERRKAGREERGEMEEDEIEDDGKRAVTYQISRNRGLIPQRKKELRNPRVKHRNKYRKALIKRKSQVRAVVAELNRYGGETSGIRANVSHSIKIK